MDLTQAKSVLDLNSTFTLIKLKRAYRFKAMMVHPDKGGTQDAFFELKTAFDLLKIYCEDPEAEEKQGEYIGDKPLSEFGKGYPITESARTCDDCEGKGYKSYEESRGFVDVQCPDCKGDGAYWVPCKKCSGSGKFKNHQGKEVGLCHLCGGNGKFYPLYKKKTNVKTLNDFYSYFMGTDLHLMKTRTVGFGQNRKTIKVNTCSRCHGRSTVSVKDLDDKKKYYMKCGECNGIGEIKMWNPVIPRGLFHGKQG